MGGSRDKTVAERGRGTITTGEDRLHTIDPTATSAFDPDPHRFEEVGELGCGGMGRVAEVYDRALGRNVAVKTVLVTDATAFARFEREVRITALLEHPGIVPVYEVGRTPEGAPYYVMRRVDGVSLAEAVQHKNLAERLALVPSFLGVCDAMAYAHARGIIHRDIKPTNMLLGPFGEALVIDWGLARLIDQAIDDGVIDEARPNLTRVGAVTGTPGFMAPEQARGERVDRRSDVFALGATLFYLLSGEFLHDTPDATELMVRVAADQPIEWARLDADVPADLRAILGKALAAEAATRYADAGELAADLRRFVTGQLVAARDYGTLERLRRFVRKHRVLVLAAIAVVAIGVVAFVRVAAERDAATAAQRTEAERADDLTISNARQLVATEPALAVGLVRPLAAGPRWREVADVLAAASGRGVPWRYETTAGTRALEVSPDGIHALAIGGDGVARLYDLEAHATRVIAPHASLGVFPDAGHVVLFDDRTLISIDLATGGRSEYAIEPATFALAAAGSVAWIDRNHRAWRWPQAIELADPVVGLALAADGTVALRTGDGVWIASGIEPPRRVFDERAFAVAWNGGELLVVRAHDGALLTLREGSWEDLGARAWPDSLVGARGAWFAQSTAGFSSARGTTAYGAVAPAGLVVARDQIAIAATSDGMLDAVAGEHRARIPSPAHSIERLAASSRSRFVVAAAGSDVLAWDLAEIMPREVTVEHVGAVAAGPHGVLALGVASSTWIDLARGTLAAGPTFPGVTRVAASASDDAVAISNSIAYGIHAGISEAKVVAQDALLASGNVIAVKGGGLLVGGRTLALAHSPKSIVASGGFVVAIAADGALTRIETSTDRRTTLALRASPLLPVVEIDGRVWFVAGRELRCWHPDGAVTIHVVVPGEITNLFVVDSRHLALDTATAGWIVDRVLPGALRRTVAFGTQRFPAPTLAVSSPTSANGGLIATGGQLVDADTGIAWPIGATVVGLARDGSAYYEVGRDAIFVWPIERPRSASATEALADRITNAVAERSNVGWR